MTAPTPPPTTTTPTLAQCIAYYSEQKYTPIGQATLDALEAHESALRREAVLREALRVTKAYLEYADYLPDIEPMTTVLAALADSGSGG